MGGGKYFIIPKRNNRTMTEYHGEERRKDYIKMDGRLVEAEEKIGALTTQITVLCTELPYLKSAIDGLTKQIKAHEDNAMGRQVIITSCRDERIRATESIRWLWVFFSLFTVGLLFAILKK